MKQKFTILASVLFFTIGIISNARGQWFDCFCTLGSKIFAGAQGGLLVSSDTGRTWIKASPNFSNRYSILALATDKSNLYAGTDSGVFRSVDTGVSWIKTSAPAYYTAAVTVFDSTVYAGLDGIYRSIDNGQSWIKYSFADSIGGINCFISRAATLIAGSYSGVLRSTDSGKTWNSSNFGFPEFLQIRAFAQMDSKFFVASDKGIFISTNDGKEWAETDTTGEYFSSLAVSGTNLFGCVGDAFGGVFLSTNFGRSWRLIDITPRAHSLFIFGDYLFVGSSQVGITRILLRDWIDKVKTEVNSSLNITLFPNPTTGIITVRNAPENIQRVIVLNVLGESVIEFLHPNSSDLTLDLSKLPVGTYFVRLSLPDRIITQKIIKE